MENLKIRVNTAQESKEAQELFFELGYGFFSGKNKVAEHLGYTNEFYFFAYGSDFDLTVSANRNLFIAKNDFQEINLPQLRDMVVLKRNDINDATHRPSIGYPQYHCSCGGVFQFFENKWNLSHNQLPPIKEEAMKEYLFKYNNQYTLVELSKEDAESNPEQYIEIPCGMNFAWRDGDSTWFTALVMGYRDAEIIWQRESLNDKVASAEAAMQELKGVDATLAERQSQYGGFVGVANTTGQLMAVIINSPNGHTMPYAHEEALHMICSKIARIMNGDINSIDGWHDIAGYATLIERIIGDSNVREKMD